MQTRDTETVKQFSSDDKEVKTSWVGDVELNVQIVTLPQVRNQIKSCQMLRSRAHFKNTFPRD